MTKVFCSDSTCEFVDDEGYCSKDRIEISYCTSHQGPHKQYHLCRSKQRDPEYDRIAAEVYKQLEEEGVDTSWLTEIM